MENNKKKIVYFVPEFPRLTETFIEREISKLIEFGNLDIKVVSLAKASGFMSDNVKDKVDYKRLTWQVSFLAGFYFFTRFKEISEAYSIVRKDTSKKFLQRLYLFLKAIGYAKIIESYKPGHIHVHFLSDPSTIVLIVSKILRVPFSVSAHARDVYVEGTLIPEKAQAAKFIAICNTYAWNKCVELSGAYAKKIRKIFHGVDADKLFVGSAKMPKPQRPMIFVGSRLVEKKGLKYAVEASKLLKDRGIAHEMYIIGLGPLYNELVKMIRELGLENNVFIPGNGNGIPNTEVMEYFKVADIFAHPSIETGEGDVDGVPTYVIEAALAKLPIVTTNAGSITDLIDDTRGILVPQKNSYDLANAIEKLIYDPVMRTTLGEAAFAKAKEMFDITKNGGVLEKLLLES